MSGKLACLLSLLVCASCLYAQDASTMTYAAPASSKFATMPGLPACMTIAVQRGDPSQGPSVLLLKFSAGCTVPWHWHTAAENLILVSGTGKAQMKDGQPQTMKTGDYMFLPAKNIHQFTAVSNVLLFDLPDGAFDIHYVDSSGNEIPPDKALKGIIKVKPMAAPTTTMPQ